MAWGGISLVGVLFLAGFFAYQVGPGNRDKFEQASVKDVRFVLNWCGLGEKRTERVIHSYQSGRSFTGDHFDAYWIKISNLSIKELCPPQSGLGHGGWYRGDQLPKVPDEALQFIMMFPNHREAPWFPTAKEIRSSRYFVQVWFVQYHGDHVTNAQVIIARPDDSMIFYISGKT
ncbi:MAG: hypothetical protein NTZ01_06120 [Verrucomicrobia bacterium]|nr:hypothetical protein [Verrucomicrobiota bacterium]